MSNCGNITKPLTRLYNTLYLNGFIKNPPTSIDDSMVLWRRNLVLETKSPIFMVGEDGKLIMKNGVPVTRESYFNQTLLKQISIDYGMNFPEDTQVFTTVYPKDKYEPLYIEINMDLINKLERFGYEYQQNLIPPTEEGKDAVEPDDFTEESTPDLSITPSNRLDFFMGDQALLQQELSEESIPEEIKNLPTVDSKGQLKLFGGKYSLLSDLPTLHEKALDHIIKNLSDRFDIPIKKVFSEANWKGRFTSSGEIELNIRTLRADTPFHEIAHPFIDLIEKNEPELFSNLIKQIKKEKSILEQVQNNSYYKNLPEMEQVKEAIVTAIGRYAAYNINTKTGKGLISAIKQLLKLITKYLKNILKAEEIRLPGDFVSIATREKQQLGKLKTISPNTTLSDLGAFFALGKGKYSLQNTDNILYNRAKKYEGKHLDVVQDVLKELKNRNVEDRSFQFFEKLALKLSKKYPTVFNIENVPKSKERLDQYFKDEQSFMENVAKSAEEEYSDYYRVDLNKLNYVKQLITYGSNYNLLNLMFEEHPNINIIVDNDNKNVYGVYVKSEEPSKFELEDREYVYIEKYNKWISISKSYTTERNGYLLTSYNSVDSSDENWEKVIAKFQKLDTDEFRPKLEQFVKKNILRKLEESHVLKYTRESYVEKAVKDMTGMYSELTQLSPQDIIAWANETILKDILFANDIVTSQITEDMGLFSALNAYHPFVQELYTQKKKEFDKALLEEYKKRKEALKAILEFKNLQKETELDLEEFENIQEESDIAAPIPKWFLDMYSIAGSGKYFDDIGKGIGGGLAQGVTYLSASQEWDKKLEYPEYETTAEKIINTEDLSVFLRDYFYPDYFGASFQQLKQQFKTKYSIPTKPGVQELFETDNNLANQIYEALGFKKDLSYDTFKKIMRPKGYGWSILEGGKKVTIGNKEFNFNIATGDNIGQAVQWVIDNNGSKKEVLSIIEVFLKEYQNKSPENYKPLDYIIKEAIEDGNFFQKLKNKSISLEDIAKNNAKRIFDNLLELYYEVYSGNIADIKTDVKENSKDTGYKFLDDRLDYYSGLSQQQKQQAIQLYSQYLDTIFPDSQVKDIVYHGSKYKFEKFDKSKLGSNTNPNKEFPQFNDSYLGFHFTSNPKYYRNRFEFGSKYEKNLNEYIAILNIQKPKDIADKDEFSQNNIQFIKPEDVKNNDSIIYDYLDTVHYEKGNIYTNNYVVFEPEQIHILGSKQDIEGFKQFVEGETTPTIKEAASKPRPPEAIQLTLDFNESKKEQYFQDFYSNNQNIDEDTARDFFDQCML